MTYRICTKCDIHHYENCHTCFGFGVWHSGCPVSADLAHQRKEGIPFAAGSWKPCPECGSTPDGVPKIQPLNIS